MIASTLVAFSVSVAFCQAEPNPVVCLNELVKQAHPHNHWANDPVPEDNSAIVIARGTVP